MPRLRALRESLTSHRAAARFVRAFELSADAALRAGDHGEWLKAASALLGIYPRLAPAAEARGARAAHSPTRRACLPPPLPRSGCCAAASRCGSPQNALVPAAPSPA